MLTKLMARMGWTRTKCLQPQVRRVGREDDFQRYEYDLRCVEHELAEAKQTIETLRHVIGRLEKQHQVTMEAICSHMPLLPASPIVVTKDEITARRRPHASEASSGSGQDPSSSG